MQSKKEARKIYPVESREAGHSTGDKIIKTARLVIPVVLLSVAIIFAGFYFFSKIEVVKASPQIETLRPNAAGDSTQLTPSPTVANYLNVDEASADEDATYNYPNCANYYDLYNLENHTAGSGDINFVKVYVRGRADELITDYRLWIGVKTEGVEHEADFHDLFEEAGWDYVYVTVSDTWNNNPETTNAWTWTQIDNLQVKVRTGSDDCSGANRVTQVYVEVNYTPAAGGATPIVGTGIKIGNGIIIK